MWDYYPIEEECLECLRRREEKEDKRQRNLTNGVLVVEAALYGGAVLLAILALIDHFL